MLNMKLNSDGNESGIREIPSKLKKTECDDIIKQNERTYHSLYYRKNKRKIQQYYREYRLKNKSKLSEKSNRYYQANKEKILIRNVKDRPVRSDYNRKYYRKNRRKLNRYRTRYLTSRYNTDILFKIKHLLRTRLNDACRERGFIKSKRTIQILGCNLEQFKSHIESLFTVGMIWDNYGKLGWHIDHIIPLASAKTQQELEALCHYKNLQPLWWNDNLRKGSKLITS